MKTQTLISLLLVVLLGSCKKAPLLEFQLDKSTVYFYLNENASKNQITKSFNTTLEDQMTVKIPIKCSGVASAQDRNVRFAVVSSGTTAESGVEFEPLKESYVFPANAYTAEIPIVLKRSARLSEQSVELKLTLLASSDFEIGDRERQEVVILFSAKLEKPSNWNTSSFKTYSQKKHQIFLILTDRQEYPTPEEYSKNEYYYKHTVSRLLSSYFRDNYPVKDENGNTIEPW